VCVRNAVLQIDFFPVFYVHLLKKTEIEKQNNHIYFYKDVNTESCLELNKKIIELNKELLKYSIDYDCSPPNIYLHINSNGGELFAAFSTVDTIKNSKIPIKSLLSLLHLCNILKSHNRYGVYRINNIDDSLLFINNILHSTELDKPAEINKQILALPKVNLSEIPNVKSVGYIQFFTVGHNLIIPSEDELAKKLNPELAKKLYKELSFFDKKNFAASVFVEQ
jgi:hypothetical protein